MDASDSDPEAFPTLVDASDSNSEASIATRTCLFLEISVQLGYCSGGRVRSTRERNLTAGMWIHIDLIHRDPNT